MLSCYVYFLGLLWCVSGWLVLFGCLCDLGLELVVGVGLVYFG